MRKQNLHKILGVSLALAAIPASAPLFGCDSQVFAANTTVNVTRRASPGVQHIRDPEIAEAAIPAAIQQSEGLLMLAGDNLELRSSLSRTYGSFGYGFMEEHMEQAEFDGADEEVIEHWRTRASLAYERGRAVAIEAMDNERPNGVVSSRFNVRALKRSPRTCAPSTASSTRPSSSGPPTTGFATSACIATT